MTTQAPWPIPLPEPLPLAAPVWLFQALLLLTFFLHLLAMNALVGGSILALVARLGRGTNPHVAVLTRRFQTAAPVLMAATVTLGVAPLLFLQALYGRLFFPSSIVMAWWWMAVVALVMAAYAATYVLAWGPGGNVAMTRITLAIVVALALFVAFIYVNNMTLMLDPARISARYLADGRGLQLNSDEATLVPRYLHFIVSAVAVGALTLVTVGLARRRMEPELAAWATRQGLRWFAGATGINVLVGSWWLLSLPRETMLAFMGRDRYATGVLTIGIVLGLTSLALAVVARRRDQAAGLTAMTLTAALATVAVMVLTRDTVRQLALRAMAFEHSTNVAPQWGPIGLFVVLLVLAVAVVVWMVTTLTRARPAVS